MKKKFLVITLISALILSCSAFVIWVMPEKAKAADGETPAPITMAGASIRTAAPFGLRFEAEVDPSVVNDITELGMYLCPTDLLTNGEFPTGTALSNALIQGDALATETKYIKRVVVGGKGEIKEVTDGNGTHNRFYLALVNIVPGNLDRKFSAMAYIKIGEGDEIKAESIERSVAYVAREAKADQQSGLEGDSLKFVESIIADSNELSVLSGVADMAAENRHNGQFSRKITLTEATTELKLRVNYKKMENADKCSLEMYAKAAGEGVKIGGESVSTDEFTKLHFENLALTNQELTLSLEGNGDLWIDDIKYTRISNADGTVADIGGENVTKLGVDCLEINTGATDATLKKDETTNFMVYKDVNGESYSHANGCFHIKDLAAKVSEGDYIVFRIKMTEDTVNGIVRSNDMKLFYQSKTGDYKYMQFFDEQGNDWSFYEDAEFKAPYNILCNADYVPQADTWYYAVTLYGYQNDFEWFRAITGPFEITFGEVYKLSEAGKNEHFHTGIRPIILDAPETLSLTVGESKNLGATVQGGDNPVIEYKVLDSALVSVDESGNVTAGEETGECTIEIKTGDVVKTCVVMVKNVVITCPARLYTYVGDTIKVEAAVTGSENPLKYTSGNTLIATVNEDTGEVTAVAAGSCEITIAVDGAEAKCLIIINEAGLKPPVLEGEGITALVLNDRLIELDPAASQASLAWDENTGFVTYSGPSDFNRNNGHFHINGLKDMMNAGDYVALQIKMSDATIEMIKGYAMYMFNQYPRGEYSTMYMAYFDEYGNDWTVYNEDGTPNKMLNDATYAPQAGKWYYFITANGCTEAKDCFDWFTMYSGPFELTIGNIYLLSDAAKNEHLHTNIRPLRLNAPETFEVHENETLSLGASLSGGDESNYPAITYAVTAGDEYASVAADGKVTGIKSGNCTITITAGELVKTCAVTVSKPYFTVPEHIYTYVGDTLIIHKQSVGMAGVTFTYQSDADTIATVDSTGTITAHAVGTCNITVSAPGMEAKTCRVHVHEASQKPPVPNDGETGIIILLGVDGITKVPDATDNVSLVKDDATGFITYSGNESFSHKTDRFCIDGLKNHLMTGNYVAFQIKFSQDTIDKYIKTNQMWFYNQDSKGADGLRYMAYFDKNGADWNVYEGTQPYRMLYDDTHAATADDWFYVVTARGYSGNNFEFFTHYYGSFEIIIGNVYIMDQTAYNANFHPNPPAES